MHVEDHAAHCRMAREIRIRYCTRLLRDQEKGFNILPRTHAVFFGKLRIAQAENLKLKNKLLFYGGP